ncbi:hypothetical protein [Candidatus Poriferisocius sp.]|uniref:hypothetical protein n=1 Tax=Candidatus Poriferisocius sp. TaxID=3101276 RepID=UPI003B01E6EA
MQTILLTLKYCLLAFGGVLIGFIFAGLACNEARAGEHRLDLAFSVADDGSCSEATETISLTYDYAGDRLDAYGKVRQAPSAGDCRTQGLAYTVDLAPSFDCGTFGYVEWECVAKLSADRHTLHAQYALANGTRRADGRPMYLVTLPAGSIETVTAALGATATIGWLEVTLAVNTLELDWADGSSGRTLHAAVSTEFPLLGGSLELAADVDADGDHAFGSARSVWRSGRLYVGLFYDFGLLEGLSDAPETMKWYGEDVVYQGPGQDTATRLEVGVTF